MSQVNPVYTLIVGGATVLLVCWWLLPDGGGTASHRDAQSDEPRRLILYCAAGMRAPVEQSVKRYREETGVEVSIQYGGSNTLLSQIEVAQLGDLFLAADESYLDLAREKGLVKESVRLARMTPVVGVNARRGVRVTSLDDLMRLRVAIGNPDQAAIGRQTRKLLQQAGRWDEFHQHIREAGVYKPTVNDIAADVMLGSVDACVLWDAVANQSPEIAIVRLPELSVGAVDVAIGVLSSSRRPQEALRFAHYLAASDRGQQAFAATGYEIISGDPWEAPPATKNAGKQ